VKHKTAAAVVVVALIAGGVYLYRHRGKKKPDGLIDPYAGTGTGRDTSHDGCIRIETGSFNVGGGPTQSVDEGRWFCGDDDPRTYFP